MGHNNRCLYDSDIKVFLAKDKESIFGVLCDRYHGDALTTTSMAWMGDIAECAHSMEGKQRPNNLRI